MTRFFMKQPVHQVLLVSTCLTFGAASAYARPALPRTVSLVAEKIYVPNGFDSNDNVEFVIHGNLPSSCYKYDGMDVVFDEATKTFTAKPKALKYKGDCLQMLIPFTVSQKIGLLKPGNYSVKQEGDKSSVAALVVRAALNDSPDDYLYAPVDNVKLQPMQEEAGAFRLTIEGKFPYMFVGCMQMNKVLTDVQKDILVVQPVAEIVEGEACTARRPDNGFSHKSIIRGLTEKQILVHVRSLNGESHNRYFEKLAGGGESAPE